MCLSDKIKEFEKILKPSRLELLLLKNWKRSIKINEANRK